METLLAQPLDSIEQKLRESLRKIVPKIPQLPFSESLLRSLGLTRPGPYFTAILSLIQLPLNSSSELALCRYLLDIPQFYVHLVDPSTLNRPALINVCRIFMRIDARFDVKLISALTGDSSVDRECFLRVLSVLDEVSPGGRLTMTLARVMRDAEPAVASKLALLMGHRVSNPLWTKQQLSSKDARTRANVIETLWGVDTPDSRRWLKAALGDSNNRVVGNALLGLKLLKDDETNARIREIASHPEPAFRMTAAWLMGKIGDPTYRDVLTAELTDPDRSVRDAAERALAALPKEEQKPAEALEIPPTVHSRLEPVARPESGAAEIESRRSDESTELGSGFDLRFDGTLRRRIYTR